MLPETLTGACGVHSADMRDSFLVPRRFAVKVIIKKQMVFYILHLA